MAIRVLIVAAYASARAGLHALLAETEECEVIGEVGGSAELERLLPEVHPDAVLFDHNEADATRVLASLEGGETALVVLGEDRDDLPSLAAASLPGWAYLLREADAIEIAAAVRAAAVGLVALDRSLAQQASGVRREALEAASGVRHEASECALEELAPDAWRPTPDEALTPREREVLQWMAEGLPNKSIAARLGISPHTVKFHVASILSKLGAASRTEAVTLGARRGEITL